MIEVRRLTRLQQRVIAFLEEKSEPVSASDVYEMKTGRRPRNVYQSSSMRAHLNKMVASGLISSEGRGAETTFFLPG